MKIERSFTTAELLTVFLTYAVLTAIAFLAADATSRVLFHQVLNTVRVTMVLFTVAMCLYVLPNPSARRSRYWLLFWTAAYVSYAVHVYISFGTFFNFSFADMFRTQGVGISVVNWAITAWWTLDILLAWLVLSPERWMMIQRTALNILVLGTFFVSTVIFHAVDKKQTFVIVLGALQTLIVLVCFVIRIRAEKQSSGTPESVPL